MDEVLHQLQENMEQECDTYFDRIKPELVEVHSQTTLHPD